MDIVVMYSGGLDSTTLLYHLQARGERVLALSVDYGQRHRVELAAAQGLCTQAGIEHLVLDLQTIRPLLAGSSQTDDQVAVPHGHYADATMRTTVVPNRNMLLLALATAWAISRQAEAIAYAAHGGDHAIYPDCRPAFVDALRPVLACCDWHPVQLLTPFLTWDKTAIIREGVRLGVPFARTWSCYDPQPGPHGPSLRHCGQCGACVERQLSFRAAAVPDPTEYADVLDVSQNVSL